MKASVLVCDDEKNIRGALSMILRGAGCEVREAATGEEALAALAERRADVVLLDIGLPGIDGLEALRRIVGEHPGVATVMISGQATITHAVEATRIGAFDFLEKPLDRERILLTVRNALSVAKLGEEVDRLRRDDRLRHEMVGRSPAMRDLRERIARIAPTPATVLITGESGTGKEGVARALHEGSPRREKPFVKVNCAAIPEELIETELFGCRKGAYTGADRDRDGKFQQADGGTIFLDEIGDMSLRVQAKVLRALQEGEIERVGEATPRSVDVRILAATNKDLPEEVRAGRFREDLYYRLHVVPLEVPPLRHRREDVARLADHFLSLYAAESGLPRREIAPEALELLAARRWRGNVRELRNVIERLAILAAGPGLTAEDLRQLAPEGEADAAPAARAEDAAGLSADRIREQGGLVEARREFERRCIEICLDAAGGNVSRAARLLRIERSNLHKKMQAHRIEARPPRPGGPARQPEGEQP